MSLNMRQMAQSLSFAAGGQNFDVSNQSLVSQQDFSSNVQYNFSKEHTFGSFEQASISLNNATAYEDRENGRGSWFNNHNQQGHESMYNAPSQRSATLDPLEEKLLFNMDDNLWDISSGKCVESDIGSPSNALGHANCSVTFPSVQCGSWSALMQSTLAETSTVDTGMQEEWSGLTFQNAVITAQNQSATPVISSSVPQHSLLHWQHVSCLPDDSQPVETELYSAATISTNSITLHYTDSDVLPVSQSVNQLTALPIHVEKISGSPQNHNKQVTDDVTSKGSSAESVIKYEVGKHTSSEVIDTDGLLTSDIQESMKNSGGCPVKNTSVNLMSPLYGNQGTTFLATNNMTDEPLAISRPNKRKLSKEEHLPWHKEVDSFSVSVVDTRMEEEEWAQATSRLIEAGNDAELYKPDQSLNQPRKRLILTTKIMQNLLPPAPGTIISKNATLSYETAVYIVARILLGDACNMSAAYSKSKFTDEIEMEEPMTGNRAVNSYSDRIKQLEDNFQRLNNRPSFVDIKVEYLELERFSVINRFAKFHSRIQPKPSGGQVSSSPTNMYLQRYVAAQPMPKDVPDGLMCLALD